MKISVVIPVFNQLWFTKECIKSIHENFVTQDYEIVIIDNWSTDGTKEWALSEFIQDKRNRYIRNEKNEYVTPAWNKWFNESIGEFVIFMNNDLTVPKWLDESLLNSYEWKIVCPATLQVWTKDPFYQLYNINGTCWMIKRSDWKWNLPESLLLWYSDDFAFKTYWVTWNKSVAVIHHGSKTLNSLPEANPIIANDTIEWKKILKQNGWTDLRFPNL